MSLNLTNKLKSIRDLLVSVCEKTYHYEYPERTELREYIIWQEDGEGDSLHADNSKREQVIQFTVDLFTKTEYSPLIDGIQNTLADSTISFSLVSVVFETETKYIHYQWQAEM